MIFSSTHIRQFGVGLSLVCLVVFFTQGNIVPNFAADLLSTQNPPPDTVVKDRRGDKYVSEPQPESPFNAPEPSNVKTEFEINEDYEYTVKEKVGDNTYYRAPSNLSFEEFMEMKRREMIKDHWRNKAKTKKDSSRVNNDPIEWSFAPNGGEPIVSIRPAGNVTISLGGKWQRTENPAFPVNQQRTGGIDFDQQISLSLAGTIGDRIKVNMNWDTKAAFDFDNNFKVAYEGKDYDIIKDIQVGNVSMPVDNSLIKGAQNLFGVKTKMQFGKLDVTAVVSQQRGVTETITIKGGGLARPIDKQASDYEYNRHFFLSHYFKKKFDEAYQRNPTAPNIGVRITRLEVYRTNISNQTDELRSVAALVDLGENGLLEDPDLGGVDDEGFLYNKSDITGSQTTKVPSNDANDLYATMTIDSNFRQVDQVVSNLSGIGLVSGSDFEVINSARRLTENSDYTFHPDLGYISLNSSLKDDEALAIAFEYTFEGVTYKVGELPEDYQNFDQVDDVVFLKLLKPQSINTALPTWSLMMKNIYSLNTSNVQEDQFQLRVIYKDDISGVDNPSLQEGNNIDGVPLLRLLNLDKLDPNGDFKPDGNFDFLDMATINATKGKVVFPVQEPYGKYLDYVFSQNDPDNAVYLSGKYSFQTLYDGTQNDARQKTSRDKFFLKGSYQSATSTDISLPGINVAEGSVSITVGSQTLVEGSDFTVDYQFGRVKILNEGVLASGKDIIIRYEKADLFNVRAKSLIGTRLAYNFSDKVALGFTWMYLNERPFLTRVNIGSEPIRNTQLGLDLKFADDSRVITKIVDALPGYNSTKESKVDLRWEIAALKPGHSKVIGETGTSYIDDFEGAATPYDFTRSPFSWKISSVPFGHQDYGLDSTLTGFHRAKLNWFTVDQSFYQSNNNNPGFSLTDECVVNNFTRGIIPQEIFVNRDPDNGGIILNQAVLDVAYYPKERGPYNYNTNDYSIFTDNTGNNVALYNSPEDNWASMVRPITFDTDFEKANIEYLEFWVMSPFVPEGSGIGAQGSVHPDLREEMERTVPYPVYQANSLEGTVSFHLGDVNEDVLNDGVQSFENGLPDEGARETVWGQVTSQQFITNAFDNTQDRALQDVGLEGLNNVDEQTKHEDFSNWARANGLQNEIADPSTDDYEYFINESGDERCILERYRNYNGLEGNSEFSTGNETFPQPSYTTPDNEDINQDKTLSFSDRYFEYDLEINANTFSQNGIDNNPYIVDRVVVNEDSDESNPVEWYQVRIPLANGKRINGINNFQTIKFFRMNMSGFEEPVMLRMVELQLVSAQWRRYGRPLDGTEGANGTEIYDPNFTVGVVNIEQNSTSNGSTSPYTLPPGVIRDLDQTSAQVREQNEQSMLLSVRDLEDGDARAVFKNMAIDMINYDKLEMYVHAEAPGTTTDNNQTTCFVRFGTDNEEHYYEVEVPLTLSDVTNGTDTEVWREENHFDIEFKEIINAKLERNNSGYDKNTTYPKQVGKHTVRVKGNPDQSAIRSMMIGIRNPADDGSSKTVTIWVNELRVTGFNEKMGFATTGEINIQAADLMKITGSMKYVGNNYGDIENTISQRTREQKLQYGTSLSIDMDKFLPKKWGLKIPVYTSYDRETNTPMFNPLDPDVKTSDAINSIEDADERAEFKNKVKYQKEVKSVNVTNLRKTSTNPKKKKKVYSVENLTVSAGYTEENRSGISSANADIGNNLQSYKKQKYVGTLGYSYTVKQKPFKPFDKSKMFKAKSMKLIKDFNWNFLPNDFSFKFNLDRTYTRTQLYNSQLTTDGVAPTYEKAFFFNRDYNFSWNFSKSLRLTYKAKAGAIIDEPEGDKNGDELVTREFYRDTVRENLLNGGRLKTFNQEVKLTYKIPINKLPLLDWVNSDASYKTKYQWTAGAFGNDDPNGNFYGNLAQNSQEMSLTGKASLLKLYNKSKFLKKINNPPRKRKGIQYKAILDTTGKSKTFYAEDLDAAKKRYPKAISVKKVPQMRLLKGGLRLLMVVRDVQGSYKQTSSILLPGFSGEMEFMGMDTRMDNYTDYIPFVLGYQGLEGENGIKDLSRQNGWLTQSSLTNETITQRRKKDLNLKANLEPIKSFKVALTLKQTKTTTYSEVYRREDEADDFNDYITFNPVMGGSVSMSTITLGTMFNDDVGENGSRVFEQFSGNRSTIQNRLNAQDQTNQASYGDKHQDVMIPAFLAAYSGQDASKGDLSRLPSMPLPNWRVDYNGLSKLKMFKKKFSSISLKHAYNSKYDISNYTSSLTYRDINYRSDVSDITDNPETNENGEYVPEFAITEVKIQESFKPLVGVNIRTKKKWSLKVDYNKTRNVALSMANAQVTELRSNDIIIGIGKTWKKGTFRLPGKTKGGSKRKPLKNELTLKVDFSIKDTKTTQRSLDGGNTVTAGNWNFQLKPNVSYKMNKRATLQLYFERTINDPYISTSFRRSTTAFGFRLRFNLQ